MKRKKKRRRLDMFSLEDSADGPIILETGACPSPFAGEHACGGGI